jgi:two-component system chemotaxis sensor kinase CheA
VLRVDPVKVDRLLETVGELVVAKNALPFVVDSAEGTEARRLAAAVRDQYGMLSRITDELQTAVMDIRMLPVSVAFARVPRLVRDLSRMLGKDVQVRMTGQDTAADKDVIEALTEPLVHLVRNSLDHGIEAPDARRAAGKPQTALLRLHASSQAGAVLIEVGDDGRGIDAARVRRTAVERGVVDAATAEAMSDEDAHELIFRPGFSTATEISAVSGRGVGMDAVRASIERLGGDVVLQSTPGRGTTVRLRLPLSMAVSQVMVVRAGGQLFGVPVSDVLETVSLRAARVQHAGDQRLLDLRGTAVQVVNLGQVLDLPAVDGAEASVLVCQAGDRRIGLAVDGFQQNIDVILKPLEGAVGTGRCLTGAAILGDGAVLLVLDPKEVIRRAAATH